MLYASCFMIILYHMENKTKNGQFARFDPSAQTS